MKRRDHLLRYIALGFIFVAVSLVYIARLITIQIASQDYYTETVVTKTYTRTEPIQAQRGEIYDRNGKVLVENKYTYDLYLDGGSFPKSNEDKNNILLKLTQKAKAMDEFDGFNEPRAREAFVYKDGKWSLDNAFMGTVYGKRLSKLMVGLNFTPDDKEKGGWTQTDIGEVRDALLLRYGLVDADGNDLYSEEERDFLFPLRLDMELKNFSAVEPYTLITDVSVAFISAITEGGHRGYNINVSAERVYTYPGYLSHVLGRVGQIQAENAQYYTDLGYSLNAIVGTSGAEKSFEAYLHGTDGTLAIVEDKYGNIVETYVLKEPVAGQDVYLTIDIDLQMVAETALKNNIQTIVDQAIADEGEFDGEDANAGALTALNSKTGEVLVLANYPSYNLATFNEDYSMLREDPASPLFNRSLEGIYEPGSTFKIGMAAAALQEGIITPYTEILDEGEYQYYADSNFTPACWIYSARYGYRTHGWINVSKAIEVSCNCFFYDVGRQLTITRMNKYCKAFGLGEATGIELSEKTGVLAGPTEREAKGETWYDGDTIQAAIGQSDNLFTPLQISNYISTVLSEGDRMKAHILYQVRDYHGNITYEFEPQIVDSIELSSKNALVVKNAMRSVITEGSAVRIFVNYPLAIGGKTGTAQVSSTSSDNAIFTAFAPFDDPEIVATCIIEKGASGTDAGYSVRDLFTSYFNVDYPLNGVTEDTTTGEDGANE
ncbi:MAG: hypothetical protein J6C03_01430 [Clostridia bacterium]|nr:hypothetical protein [Clostridia bacterium]